MRAVKYLLTVHMGFGNMNKYRTLYFVTILPRDKFLGLCFNIVSIFDRLCIKVDVLWIHIRLCVCVEDTCLSYNIDDVISVCIYVGFKTLFYVVRHLDSTASYLPNGLHLGFFLSWPSLHFPSSFSSVFLVLSFVSIFGGLVSSVFKI